MRCACEVSRFEATGRFLSLIRGSTGETRTKWITACPYRVTARHKEVASDSRIEYQSMPLEESSGAHSTSTAIQASQSKNRFSEPESKECSKHEIYISTALQRDDSARTISWRVVFHS